MPRPLVGILVALMLAACSSAAAQPARSTAASPSPHGGPLLAGTQDEPPWPPEVGTAVPDMPDCNAPGWPHTNIDPAVPGNVRELAAKSWQIVVADAVDQRPFWGTPGQGVGRGLGGWLAFTATNFHVVRVIKGHPTPWVQRLQEGAAKDSLPCPHYIDVVSNTPPPKVGARYLLFDFDHFQIQFGRPQQDQGFQGTWWRFLVVDGVVHSEAEGNPRIDAMAMTPAPLDDFLHSIGL
jgi:hypothetical protein